MQDSIFTKIIKGEIPCHRVYEDEHVIAFLDIHPKQPGHTLVVPKQQVDLIWDLDDESYQYLWGVSKKIAQHIGPILGRRIGVQVEGIGVPHTHVHLIPFDTTDEFLSRPDLSVDPDHGSLEEMAAKLAF
jgi:histidine triad (HIT) family protein